MKKHIAILDPFSRTIKVILSNDSFKQQQTNYKLNNSPKKNKKNFFFFNIQNVSFIIWQPELSKDLLIKPKKFPEEEVKRLLI